MPTTTVDLPPLPTGTTYVVGTVPDPLNDPIIGKPTAQIVQDASTGNFQLVVAIPE